MDFEIEELKKFSDERGFLVEFVKNNELGEDDKSFGQIYVTTINPGHVRGNHYHDKKNEYYAITSGSVLLVVEDIATKERAERTVDASGGKVFRIRVGPGFAHAIKNNSDEVITLTAYASKPYNPTDPDQTPYPLI